MQFVENVLIKAFRVFTFMFCYSFYEKFIFRFGTEILRDSCEVPLLKALNRLPQSIATLYLSFVSHVWLHAVPVS